MHHAKSAVSQSSTRKSSRRKSFSSSTARSKRAATDVASEPGLDDETRKEQRLFFPVAKVHDIILTSLKTFITKSNDTSEVSIDASKPQQKMALEISDDIKERVKCLFRETENNRYKLVVYVIIGETPHTDFICASRFMWDKTVDNFAEASFRWKNVFAVAMAYGVYFD
ncbi:dynein light chain Tctex-type 5-A-like [Ciona intestinalis]